MPAFHSSIVWHNRDEVVFSGNCCGIAGQCSGCAKTKRPCLYCWCWCKRSYSCKGTWGQGLQDGHFWEEEYCWWKVPVSLWRVSPKSSPMKPWVNPDSGQYFPLGAVLFTGTPSYGQTYALIKSSGVAFNEFDPAFGYDYNPKTGAAALMQPPSPATAQALQEELARYATVWQKTFAPYAVPGYKVCSSAFTLPCYGGLLTFARRMASLRSSWFPEKTGFSRISFQS